MIPPSSYDGECHGCGVYRHLLSYVVERPARTGERRVLALCRDCRTFTAIFETIRRVVGEDWRLSLDSPTELQ